MSSLSDAERVHRWARQLRQLQRNPWWVWGSFVGGVLVTPLFDGLLAGLCMIVSPYHVLPSYRGGHFARRLLAGSTCMHPLGRPGVVAIYATNLWLRTRSGTTSLADYLHSRLRAVGGFGDCT